MILGFAVEAAADAVVLRHPMDMKMSDGMRFM